jgi:gamma-resorcylate decarboxylase
MSELSADRVLFSTDYPYESMREAATWFHHASISETDHVKIGRNNAGQLFGLSK